MDIAATYGIAVDGAGNLYVAARGNQAVVRIDTAGSFSTVAGAAGRVGFGGDGGPATSARIWDPKGVAVDAAGNLYFADRANYRVRKVDAAGYDLHACGHGRSRVQRRRRRGDFGRVPQP